MVKPLTPAKRFIYGALTGVAGALLALILHHLGLLHPLETRTWDWRAALLARPGKATEQICIIRLDQESIEWAKQESK